MMYHKGAWEKDDGDCIRSHSRKSHDSKYSSSDFKHMMN